jgi:hypothetical protein
MSPDRSKLIRSLARDSFFLWSLLAGPLFWVSIRLFDIWPTPDGLAGFRFQQLIMLTMIYPVLEELAFRGALQSSLWHFEIARKRYLGPTGANLLTSLLFVGFHLFIQPLHLALLVFFPSLLFGELRDRYQSTLPAILLHGFYNMGFYLTLIYR